MNRFMCWGRKEGRRSLAGSITTGAASGFGVYLLGRFVLGVGIPMAVVVCIWLNASLPPADWPRFRRPTGEGGSIDAKVPTEWSDDDNLEWRLGSAYQ